MGSGGGTAQLCEYNAEVILIQLPSWAFTRLPPGWDVRRPEQDVHRPLEI